MAHCERCKADRRRLRNYKRSLFEAYRDTAKHRRVNIKLCAACYKALTEEDKEK